MKKYWFGKREKNSNGQALVEIALITPLLLAALYVATDFGIAFHMGNVVSTVARDGARIGSGVAKSGGDLANPNFDGSDATTIRNAIVPQLPAYLTGRQITVRFYEDGAVSPCWESVEVTVSGNYNYGFYRLLSLLGIPTPNSSVISRTTRMRYNFQPFGVTTPCTSTPLNQTFNISNA